MIEYKRPNGEQIERQFELPDLYTEPARILAKRGYEISLEVLSGSPIVIPEKSVYMEVWKRDATREEEQAIANVLCHPKGTRHALMMLIYNAVRYSKEDDIAIPPNPSRERCVECSHTKWYHLQVGYINASCVRKDCGCGAFKPSEVYEVA